MNLPERNITAAFFAAICLAAAAVSPQQPVPGSWAYAEVPQQTLPSDDAWWEAFEDPLLDSLISEAEDANYDVLGAMHRMEAASRQIEAARAAYFPTVGIDASYTRRREEGISTNTYALGATLNWEIDLFGKVRAEVDRSRAAYRATRAEWVGTMVSMSAAMASAYIGLRTCQAELAVAREHIIRQDTIAGIARYRYECGLAAKGDVDQALTVLYSTRATVPALETSARSYINAIALLLGQYPGDVAARLSAGRNIPHFYGPVVTGVPADLLRRRPDIVQAEATLETARSSNQYAEAHYAAVQAAAAHNAVSQMELAQALSQRDQSRAAINNARAALSQARTNLAKCTIKAPMTGHIGACIYSEGAYLAGEGEPVKMTEIYSDAIMEAYFYIEDASFLRMFENPGARSDIDYTRVPVAFSERLPHDYTADMTYISPAVDPSTGTMLVRANIDNRWGELRDGMYVTVSLPYRTDPQAMLVRDASISTDQRGKYLYTVTDSNTVVYTPIETGGLVNDTMRVVTSGVRPGQRYVTQALLKVRDGMPVKPVETR